MAEKNNCKRHKKPAVLEALIATGGNISAACEMVGIGRSTFTDWCRDDQKFKEKVHEYTEKEIDIAESQLKKKIENGDLTAIIFYLKTKGRGRGYGERQQIDVQEIPTNTYIVDDDDDAKAFAEAEKKGLE